MKGKAFGEEKKYLGVYQGTRGTEECRAKWRKEAVSEGELKTKPNKPTKEVELTARLGGGGGGGGGAGSWATNLD